MNFIKSVSNFLFPYNEGNVSSSVPNFREIIRSYNPENHEESLETIGLRIKDDSRRYFEANPNAIGTLVATVNEYGTPAEYEEVALALKEAKESGIGEDSFRDLAYAVSDAVDEAADEASIKFRGRDICFSVKGTIVLFGVLPNM